MKKILLTLLLFSTVCYAQWAVLEDDPRPRNPARLFEVFTEEEWNQSNFAAENDLQWFRDAKFGMFLHFGLSTYKNAELSWGVCKVRKAPDTGSGPFPTKEWMAWKDEFRLPEFDAKKLVGYARDAGMKYLVVIAKHHDGFHMWDTALSDFKITNTPFGRDYLKEIADACHEAGIKFGIYYSQRDWVHPDYAPTDPGSEQHQRYIDYQFKAVRELCTNYGKVDIFWFDALWWGGMFNAGMWEAEKLTRMIRELQPGILINNRTNLPGDFDTPEHRIGMFQKHRPWESCLTVCNTWSYSDTPTKSPKKLVEMLVGTLCGDGNMLLSWGPKWSGEFATDQVEALKDVGEWVKKNHQAIYGTRGGPWIQVDWGGSVYKGNSIYLHLTSMPSDNRLKLDGLKQNVEQAVIHGGEALPFSQDGGQLMITIPSHVRDPLCTVIELTLDAAVTEIIPKNAPGSLFEDPAYGRVLYEWSVERPDKKGASVSRDRQATPYLITDLGSQRSIRGILIQRPSNKKSTSTRSVVVSLSTNGTEWETLSAPESSVDILEIPVTRFEAGAHIPGKNARYVKIEQPSDLPGALHLDTVKIYGE